MNDPMRVWQRDGFKLELYDTNIHRGGRWYVAYRFYDRDRLIFEGDSFSPGAGQAVDSDEAVFGVLGFMSLKPGDTDTDYFDAYTAEQMEWCRSGRAEELGLIVFAFEDQDYYQEPNGDYLISSRGELNPDGSKPVRASAIGGLASSACTTSASKEFLKTCRPIRRRDVPAEWLRYLDPENFDPEFYGLD